jgi:Carboxypeptidase regulatory-like domain
MSERLRSLVSADRYAAARVCSLLRLVLFGGMIVICAAHGNGQAPPIVPASGNDSSLPVPPVAASLRVLAHDRAPAPQGSSSISGAVLDADGAAVSGASVTLAADDGSIKQVLLSSSRGEFQFTELPPKTFVLSITAAGMASFVSSKIELALAESRTLPPIVLAVMSATTQVEVSVSRTEVAQEQVKSAEQQRVFGVLPNFYSSYIWEAAPLNARQKFDLAFHSITDPMEFVSTGLIAGAEQATDAFSGYGQGAEGYAKRYGAAYTDDVLGRMIGSAILPSLFHQDPRYFYNGSGSTGSRMFYAISQSVVTRGDNGHVEPNYSHVLGSLAAGSIANFYYPAKDRGIGLVLGNALLGTAGQAAENLVREFFARKLTPNVPSYARGKP